MLHYLFGARNNLVNSQGILTGISEALAVIFPGSFKFQLEWLVTLEATHIGSQSPWSPDNGLSGHGTHSGIVLMEPSVEIPCLTNVRNLWVF